MKETFKQAGYTFLKKESGLYFLKNSDGKIEAFAARKNYSGWSLKYKNTHLEFCFSL